MRKVNIERLKPVDNYILYSIYKSPCKELLLKEIKPYLMGYYSNHPEKKLPSYNYIYGRVHALIDMGVLIKKAERPLRLAVNKDYYTQLSAYVFSYIKLVEDWHGRD